MIDKRQLEANRRNAFLSTGPITVTGKAVSSQNSHKHGLAACIFQVLPSECQQDFDDYAAQLQAELHPITLLEKTLVMKMAQHYWLGQRAVRAQNGCFHFEFGPCVENQSLMKQLGLYIRYQAHHDRAFHKCLAELQKLQGEKRKEQIHAIRMAKPGVKKPYPQPAVTTEPAIALAAIPAVAVELAA